MSIKIGTIELNLEGVGSIKPDDLLPIDDSDLNGEFTRQASLYAYVATLAARAEAYWLESKRDIERTHAETDKEVRRDLMMCDEKVTEGKVKAEIEVRRGYRDAQMQELDDREQYLILKALTNAMQMRGDMLVSLGAHLRHEANMTGMQINQFKKDLRNVTDGVEKERQSKRPKSKKGKKSRDEQLAEMRARAKLSVVEDIPDDEEGGDPPF
jgi:hypothetical protein